MSAQVQEFYKANREEILGIIASEHLSNPKLTNLKFEFVSQSGNRYHTFKGKMDLPTIRVVKHQEFMDWYANGLMPKDHKKIRMQLFECLAHIKAKTKESAERTIQAGLLLNELELRYTLATPLTAIINIAANLLIREDEDPNKFSASIHEAKCDDIEKELENGTCAFFFNIPQLRNILKLPASSPEELAMLLQKLQSEEIRLNAVLRKVLDYMKETKQDTTTPSLRS